MRFYVNYRHERPVNNCIANNGHKINIQNIYLVLYTKHCLGLFYAFLQGLYSKHQMKQKAMKKR